MTGASKTRIHKRLSKRELDDVTMDPEYWIIELKLFPVYILKMGVIIDDVEIMAHILSNLPKKYKRIIEKLKID